MPRKSNYPCVHLPFRQQFNLAPPHPPLQYPAAGQRQLPAARPSGQGVEGRRVRLQAANLRLVHRMHQVDAGIWLALITCSMN